MRVYISGPITGHPDYMEEFTQAEKILKMHGYEVINPAVILKPLPESTTWQQYMDICMVMLRQADAIYVIGGWDNSNGARCEMRKALELGLQVLTESKVKSEVSCQTHERMEDD